MKTISVIQPWASAITLGLKRVETRSWKTNYRGPLLIHASKRIAPFHKSFNYTTFEQRYIILKTICNAYDEYDLMPTGAIIAKAMLKDVSLIVESEGYWAKLKNERIVNLLEWHLGDYTPGRYAWILEDIEMLENPIPAKGRLGLWEFQDNSFLESGANHEK
jgi:hypothetical protein